MKRLLVAATAVLLAMPTQADTWDDCNDRQDPDRMLSACSAVIDDPNTPRNRLSIALLYRCQAKDMRGSPSDALQDCQAARALDPGDSSIYNSLTIVLLKLNRISDALEAANEGIRLEPNDGNYWNGRANAMCAAGRYEGSYNDRLKALNLGRFSTEGLQRMLQQRGYYKGAIDGKFGSGSKNALRKWTQEGCQ